MTTSVGLPAGTVAVTRIPHQLLSVGIPLGPLELLETVGRRSGRRRTTPVAVLQAHGARWIVSPFGETDWVRNLRASPCVRLGRGARLRPVTLTEAPASLVPELLRTYRRRYRFVPFVRAAFDTRTGDDTDSYARVAHRHPVFRVGHAPDDAAVERSAEAGP